MVTIDELTPGTRLREPISIRVSRVNWDVNGRRAVLDAVDTAGNPLQVIDFKGADITTNWTQGHEYQLQDGRVSSGVDQFDIQLDLTGNSTVEPVRTGDTTRVYVVGDTHVGYRLRLPSAKDRWSMHVDGRELFSECLEEARGLNVDAVIHAGDIFDHDYLHEDRFLVKREIDATVESGIPFYYVLGNHDNDDVKNTLEASLGVHIHNGPIRINGSDLNLLGVDHSGRHFPNDPPSGTRDLAEGTNILVIHEKPYPVEDSRGALVYRKDVSTADITEYLRQASYGIDYVISGHQHLHSSGVVRGFETKVMVTGSPGPLRKPRDDNPFSAWLMTLPNGKPEFERLV